MRVLKHPVLGDLLDAAKVRISVDGIQIEAREGESIQAALLASGIRISRYTDKRREPRGLFCAIGQCTDCVMVVDGTPNVRTCVTRVRDGMVIETQAPAGGDHAK